MSFDFIHKLKHRAAKLAYSNVLYDWSLGGTVPNAFVSVPTDSWPGDMERGRWLCEGTFMVAGEPLQIHGECWEPTGINDIWLSYIHSFDWLRDLRAVGGDTGRQAARAYIDNWIAHYAGWHEKTWRPDIAGKRVASWISLYEFYGASADLDFQERFFDSVSRQARHLSRALPETLFGLPLLHGIKGLAFAGLALPRAEHYLEQALDLLQVETEKQILSDGGHVSRSPSQLVEALRIYIDIRNGLLHAGYPVPEQIEHNIDRMTQAVRFFRYSDKKLAVFHGGQEGDMNWLDSVLAKANGRGRILRGLPHTGFERLSQGRSVLTVDAGLPPVYPYDKKAHAAPMAFEFIYGKERIFVSCGTHPLDAQWQDVLRGTAAHNMAEIDHRNICEILQDGHMGRRPKNVISTREETDGVSLLEMCHDGYGAVNGITHRRRLFMTDQGHDLRGEESFNCSIGLGKPADIAIRFHLHPRVQVSLIREGQEALLRLGGGAGWRFIHDAGGLTLENSIYLGEGAQPRKTKQLVINARMDSDYAMLKWALRREGR